MATETKKKTEDSKKKPTEHKYGVYHAPGYKEGMKIPKRKEKSE